MKRIFVIICLVLSVLFVFGCGDKESDRVSYRQSAYLTGSIDGYKVNVVSGKKESPCIADGERGELVEFCVITLCPTDYTNANKSFTYKLVVGEEVVEGSLVKDTFGSSLSRDVGRDLGDKIGSITFSDGESEFTIPVENMTANALISGEDALKKAKAEFEGEIKAEEENGEYREIYLKFVSDTVGRENTYYWYVAFVKKNNDYFATLIDVVSGDVVAKRK